MDKKTGKENYAKGAKGGGKGKESIPTVPYANYTDKMREVSKEFKDNPFDIQSGGGTK